MQNLLQPLLQQVFFWVFPFFSRMMRGGKLSSS